MYTITPYYDTEIEYMNFINNPDDISCYINHCSVVGDAGRPHPEGADDAQLRLHQAIRGGDEGVGG